MANQLDKFYFIFVFFTFEIYPIIQKHNNSEMNEKIPYFEICQKANEILYIPAGWYHVVLNLSFVIGVTQNRGEFRESEYVLDKCKPEISNILRKRLFKMKKK